MRAHTLREAEGESARNKTETDKGKWRQRDLGDVKKDMVVLGKDFSHF